MHKVYLKPGKEESLKRFHPWIFSGAISRFDGEPEEGEVVEVYTSKKEFIAEGHFQIGSIAVRVLSFRQEPINHDFWKRKLEIAYDMRCAIGIAINPGIVTPIIFSRFQPSLSSVLTATNKANVESKPPEIPRTTL